MGGNQNDASRQPDEGYEKPQVDELMKTGWLQMMLQQPSIDS